MSIVEILQYLYERCNEIEDPIAVAGAGLRRPLQMHVHNLLTMAQGEASRSDSAVLSSWRYIVKHGKNLGLFEGLEGHVSDDARLALKEWLKLDGIEQERKKA